MTKAELKEKIAELQAELERLERRKPKDGDWLALLYPNGQIATVRYTPSRGYDVACLSRGQMLPTYEEAELYDRKRIAVTAIKDYVAENMPFTPDWKNDGQKKWTLYYDHPNRHWDIGDSGYLQFDFLLPPVSTKLEGKQLIHDCKEHLDVLLEEL